MLMVISPAKTLDFETPPVTQDFTQPEFLKESRKLILELKKLSPAEVSDLMKISDKLGTLNFLRFNEWKTPFTLNNAKQALLAFKGDVYSGIEAETFSNQDLKFAQKHLRMLSGLYGVLKPLDLMQAYRLEMGTKFENKQGKDLYEFWGTKITEQINKDLKASKSKYLINLASNEYFKSLQAEDINAEIITPVFKDFKNGKYKIISFYAKKARGLMSAYIIKNRLKDPDDIKKFNIDNYKFSKSESSGNNWVFQRKQI
ncbi:MAG: peroxide stress protein YaaA [Proteobacteria bacterium]|nr:peroxide stress protein YaaA [Pseudomonadota bacterium]NOG60377.1 peroxide stress protein YaaA [Pseudomonadota bacterium]